MLKCIATTKTGIELSYTDAVKTTLTNASIVSDKVVTKGDYDIYFHKYVNPAMKEPNRIVTLVIKKGIKPRENWWVAPTIKMGVKIG
jgi:hypothetical protein